MHEGIASMNYQKRDLHRLSEKICQLTLIKISSKCPNLACHISFITIQIQYTFIDHLRRNNQFINVEEAIGALANKGT